MNNIDNNIDKEKFTEFDIVKEIEMWNRYSKDLISTYGNIKEVSEIVNFNNDIILKLILIDKNLDKIINILPEFTDKNYKSTNELREENKKLIEKSKTNNKYYKHFLEEFAEKVEEKQMEDKFLKLVSNNLIDYLGEKVYYSGEKENLSDFNECIDNFSESIKSLKNKLVARIDYNE